MDQAEHSSRLKDPERRGVMASSSPTPTSTVNLVSSPAPVEPPKNPAHPIDGESELESERKRKMLERLKQRDDEGFSRLGKLARVESPKVTMADMAKQLEEQMAATTSRCP